MLVSYFKAKDGNVTFDKNNKAYFGNKFNTSLRLQLEEGLVCSAVVYVCKDSQEQPVCDERERQWAVEAGKYRS